jgi:hypothetical protein
MRTNGSGKDSALVPRKRASLKISDKKGSEDHLDELMRLASQFTGVTTIGMADAIIYRRRPCTS